MVANHSSHLDVGLVKHALGSYARNAASLGARDYFFKTPLRRLYFESFTEVLSYSKDRTPKSVVYWQGDLYIGDRLGAV